MYLMFFKAAARSVSGTFFLEEYQRESLRDVPRLLWALALCPAYVRIIDYAFLVPEGQIVPRA